MSPSASLLSRLDAFQRRRSWAGLPLAVIYKFGDDQGAFLAALITYYAFLSLFPLLLIFTTILGFLLHDHPQLQQQLINSALAEFPIVGDQLRNNARPLQGSGVGLAIGAAIALYGGLGLSLALQHALNQLWGVPMRRRPDPLLSRLRGLALIIMLGVGILVTTTLSAVTTVADSFGAQFGLGVRLATAVVSIVANIALFVLAFRLLTARRVTTREVLPGAVAAALAFQGFRCSAPGLSRSCCAVPTRPTGCSASSSGCSPSSTCRRAPWCSPPR